MSLTVPAVSLAANMALERLSTATSYDAVSEASGWLHNHVAGLSATECSLEAASVAARAVLTAGGLIETHSPTDVVRHVMEGNVDAAQECLTASANLHAMCGNAKRENYLWAVSFVVGGLAVAEAS